MIPYTIIVTIMMIPLSVMAIGKKNTNNVCDTNDSSKKKIVVEMHIFKMKIHHRHNQPYRGIAFSKRDPYSVATVVMGMV